MKRFLVFALALVLLVASMPVALGRAPTPQGTSIMYVKTENGKPVNVRSEPRKGDNIIGSLPYGSDVLTDWSYAGNDGWTRIVYGGRGDGYIMSRYLVSTKPKDVEQKKAQVELERQAKTLKKVKTPFNIVVRPSRASGWVNFRTGPGMAAERIMSLPEGRVLQVIGQTTDWYQAKDTETNKIGYISKSYATRQKSAPTATPKPKKKATATPKTKKKATVAPAKKSAATAAPVVSAVPENILTTKDQLGTLNVHGDFTLQCKLPDGYTMQLINAMGTKISAFITSEDKEKPVLQLSVAYDDLYGEVKRMNDMSESDLKVLEQSFRDMNDVEITYGKTAYGTKLLIAKEVGDDHDFVDILSVYEGYFIEFVMSPNPKAKNQALTDKQIQMCIDFLSELDFVAAK